MELIHLAIVFTGGIVGGLYGSSVGSAGLLSLPILILLGIPPITAIATTKPAAFVLEIASAMRFYREKKLTNALLKKGILLGIAVAIGSYIGANLVIETDERVVRVLLAAMLLLIFSLLLKKDSWGMKEKPMQRKHHIILIVASLLLGIYGGFFGFAFGTLYAVTLVLSGHTFIQGTVIARVTGTIMSLTSTIVFVFSGLILYNYAIALAIGYGIGGWVGAGIGAKRGNKYIKTLLSGVILISVARLIVEALV